MKKIDTSIEGYKYIGINLTEKQLNDLFAINLMMKGETGKDIPVHFILLVLKTLGILPPELMCEVGNQDTAQYSEDVSYEEFQKRYGKFKS